MDNNKIRLLTSLLLTSLLITSVQAAQKICVFDVMGTGGEIYNAMRDYQLFAKQRGIDLELNAYTDERVATEDFKAGQCDGAVLTGLRARQFNTFTGSVDALGAIPSTATAKAVFTVLSSAKLAGKMVQGGYEVAGIFPIGAAYLFVKDRNINTLGKIAGKKFAVLDYDRAQRKLIERIGAQPVSVEVSTLGARFNNGQLDVIGAPAMAFQPFELQKGLGNRGAIGRFPVIYLSGNLILNRKVFDSNFAQQSRAWFARRGPIFFSQIDRYERSIPEKYWMTIPFEDQIGYIRIMREARISLMKEGIYDAKMLHMLRLIRCQQAPKSFECALSDE